MAQEGRRERNCGHFKEMKSEKHSVITLQIACKETQGVRERERNREMAGR